MHAEPGSESRSWSCQLSLSVRELRSGVGKRHVALHRLDPERQFSAKGHWRRRPSNPRLPRVLGALSSVGSAQEEIQRSPSPDWGGLGPEDWCLQDPSGPNPVLLEAQSHVCTGPAQTRPLTEEQMERVLETVLASASGALPPSQRASLAQLGAFFGAMTLRANTFPEETAWQPGEERAMRAFWPKLKQCLPPEVLFLADPEGSIFGGTPPFSSGDSPVDSRLATALRDMLAGGHLGFEETLSLLRDILPLGLPGTPGQVGGAVAQSRKEGVQSSLSPGGGSEVPSDALVAAFLICQRMNRETDRELKACCLAFDQELGPAPVADVASLTHYGEPYDGSLRFFRPTLFVAAVRATYGEACLLHGVPWMPPKGGVTEEQQLSLLGANTRLRPTAAKALLEDPSVGFAYLSQREASPSLHSLTGMRLHIKKRPALATTEKVQRFVHATGRESLIAGFYHDGYEEPLLMLMRRLPVSAGLVIKGEEGSTSLRTRSSEDGAAKGKGRAVNYCAGFRPLLGSSAVGASRPRGERMGSGGADVGPTAGSGILRESFAIDIDPTAVGIPSTPTPRIDKSAEKNLKLGMAALSGERGPAFDRIIFNAAVADHLLGCSGALDLKTAVERATEAIKSGRAIGSLLKYVEESTKF